MELSDGSKQPQDIMKQSEVPCKTSEEVSGGLQAMKTENELQVISDASCSPTAPPAAAEGGVIGAPEDTQVRPAASSDAAEQECGRERLKRHREEMAGRVRIPERWGQEGLLKDWIDSSVFDEPLVPKGLRTAREALVEECRRRTNARPQLRINCSVGRS